MDLDPASGPSTRPLSPALSPSPSAGPANEPSPPPIPNGSPHAFASSMYDVPDRLTGRDSWRELERLCPRRRFNFVEVDVPYHEMREHRAKVIELISPKKTVMDLVSWSGNDAVAASGDGPADDVCLGRSHRAEYLARVLLCRARARDDRRARGLGG